MVGSPCPGYLIAGIEADYDMGPKAAEAIGNAEFVVALSSYRNGVMPNSRSAAIGFRCVLAAIQPQ